ncbi:hypothetical protein SAMN05421824_3034 [Hyunsoonleella jejuensis]|uniref:Uncharacterized protein n=1 Tax=Hyunsoonleella jejuensis TaxID=419940 RepID=A0A1H9LGL6_9FLAO|nr:nuclear transport factor 2 family protein [Hyunsoonleella jejuensis]SER10641.1 hypothetical protein SAMN05421824_3034 [Hyunsoonleella jejuensis]
MKKLLLLGLAILLFVACQNKPQRYFDASPEIDTVKAGIKAYEAGDWDSWKANFTDSTKIYHNTNSGNSPDEVMASMKQMLSFMETYGFSKEGVVTEMVVDKDGKTWVNYWGNWYAKTKVTGKKLSVPVHLTLQFIDGKVLNEFAYYDTAGINAAISEITSMSADEKTKMDAVNKVVAGWNAHDIANLKSLSVSNLVRTTNGAPEIKNIDEYEGFMKTFITAFPDFTVYADNVDIAKDKIYINWTVTGTHNGDFMGNAATGKKVKTKGFSVWTLNNSGKFVSEDAYFDNLALFSQLGINPPTSN